MPVPLAGDLPPGTVVGEYTIECKLGDGGMATVYGATHPLIGKRAAIKVMNPALCSDAALVERFVLEARAVNEIGHPNIVDVFSFGRLGDGRSYFVMERLQGMTLYERLWERRLSMDEALDIVDQICDALEAAHEKGIIHRDLKPANVFLCSMRGRRELVKLLDFGVAKLLRSSDGAPPSMMRGPNTESGQVVGTPDYISPEQARGKEVDGKTDVYALGVIAYELFLGRRPFEADNVADLVRMHLSELPPSPRQVWPEIPSSVDDLLRALLDKNPALRPTPTEVRAMVRDVRGSPPPFELPLAESSGPKSMPARSFAEADSSGAGMPSPVSGISLRPRTLRVGGAATLGLLGLGLVGAALWRTSHLSRAQPIELSRAAAHPAFVPGGAATLPAPAAAAKGTIVVSVDVTDARIAIDGRLVAESAAGARLDIEPGEHIVEVGAPGYQGHMSRVHVTAGDANSVIVRLTPTMGPGVPLAGDSRNAGAPSRSAGSSRHSTTTADAAGPRVGVQNGAAKRLPLGRRSADPDYLLDPFSEKK